MLEHGAMWCPSFLSGDPPHSGLWSLWIVWCLSVVVLMSCISGIHFPGSICLIYIYYIYIHILCMYILYLVLYYIYNIYTYYVCIYCILFNIIYIYAQLGIQVVVLEFGIPTCEGWFGKGLLFSLGTVGSKQRGWLSLKWLDLAHSQRLIEYKQFPKLGRRQYPNIFLNNKMYPLR